MFVQVDPFQTLWALEPAHALDGTGRGVHCDSVGRMVSEYIWCRHPNVVQSHPNQTDVIRSSVGDA